MEPSIASLTYKGTIPQAIAEAKMQKKLFLVYVSEEDAESDHLQKTTWLDTKVAAAVSKYCIFLNLVQGSLDALQFSAIYPQQYIPSITVIGFNGAKLWSHDGHINSENLVTYIEKAWLSINLQETLFAAALASTKSVGSGPSSPGVVAATEGVATSSCNPQSSESRQDSKIKEPLGCQDTCHAAILPSTKPEESSPKCSDEEVITSSCNPQSSKITEPEQDSEIIESLTCESNDSSSQLVTGEGFESAVAEQMTSLSKAVMTDVTNSENKPDSLNYAEELPTSQQGASLNEHDQVSTPECLQTKSTTVDNTESMDTNNSTGITDVRNSEAMSVEYKQQDVMNDHLPVHSPESLQVASDNVENIVQTDMNNATDKSIRVNKSNDVYLNIRLLAGTSIQEKFSVTDSLRLVKEYVNKNQEGRIDSYDIAIPYPRKVFDDQDLTKPLSELGLSGRHSLIVVPRKRNSGPYNRNSSSVSISGDGNDGGYFGYARNLLSYINPFAYLGGGPNGSSSELGSTSVQQYGPVPPQNQIPGTEKRYSPSSPSGTAPSTSTSTSTSTSKNKKSVFSTIGSNIHTLKHDEDEGLPKNRNTFWNGNSTEYGGDDNDKK